MRCVMCGAETENQVCPECEKRVNEIYAEVAEPFERRRCVNCYYGKELDDFSYSCYEGVTIKGDYRLPASFGCCRFKSKYI